MSAANHRRSQVLQEIARCLGGLADARSAEACADTLSVFLLRLPLVWHSVDLFVDDRVERRLCSMRCSRGFAAFVTRLGFLTRPDGVYQGTFADATLLLVKMAYHPARGSLICGIGVEKLSALNDASVMACVGALVHEALARLVAFDDRDRRNHLLESVLTGNHEFLALLDGDGRVVDRHPSHLDVPPEAVQLALSNRRRRGAQTVVTSDGRTCAVESTWIVGNRPIHPRYQVVHGREQSTAQPHVVDRLRTYGLSKRESEVAELVFSGTPNREIAQRLFISADTVKTHCRRIFGKLGISRRTEFLRVLDAG